MPHYEQEKVKVKQIALFCYYNNSSTTHDVFNVKQL